MSEPLALLPLAAAAHGGRVAQLEARQLVAAGLTLLRRSVPLVRALQGARTAILLPPGPAYLVALAASEGHGAVLIDPRATPQEIARELGERHVGAVFTIATLEARLPPEIPRVLLNDIPRHARIITEHTHHDVDLGSHTGLTIEGEEDVDGRDEEAVIIYHSSSSGAPHDTVLTHRDVLAEARAIGTAMALTPHDHVLAIVSFAHRFGLTAGLVAPLLAGARVTALEPCDPARAIDLLESGGITLVVGLAAALTDLLAAITRGRSRPRTLRAGLCGDAPPPTLREAWRDVMGAELYVCSA